LLPGHLREGVADDGRFLFWKRERRL